MDTACQPCSSDACGRRAPRRGFPSRSDVLVTSRREHYTPAVGTGEGSGLYNTWQALDAFHATQLTWVYSENASFVEQAKKRGMLGVSLATNPQVPDVNGSSWDVGRVVNVRGERLVAPWMRSWPGTRRYYGCVNSPAFKSAAFAFVDRLTHSGATSIQHDDAASNSEAVTWNGGDPHLSGCYCDVCIKGFTGRLMSTLNITEQKALNVTPSFSYRGFLLGNHTNTKLRALFVEYQRNVTVQYLQELKAHLRSTAASTAGRARAVHQLSSSDAPSAAAPLSCNNGGYWNTVYEQCDYGIGELNMRDATPGGLRYILVDTVPPGRLQVMTMPKAASITPHDKLEVRRSVAESYALGAPMIVPWDIYLPTPNASRYFGSAAEYADLFGFVRTHADWFDATRLSGYSPALNRMHLNHTGAKARGGDGARFRLPSDHPPSIGARVLGNAGSCAWRCGMQRSCAGIFVGGGRSPECWLLRGPLDTVAGTALVGYSYTKMEVDTPHAAEGGGGDRVYCTDPLVDIVVRQGEKASCGRATLSSHTRGHRLMHRLVHLISWSDRPTPLSNDTVGLQVGGVGCGAGAATLSVPGGNGSVETTLRVANCTAAYSWYRVPLRMLAPWGVVILPQ